MPHTEAMHSHLQQYKDVCQSQLHHVFAHLFPVVWNFERGSYPFLSLKLGEAVQILEENCGKLLVVRICACYMGVAWMGWRMGGGCGMDGSWVGVAWMGVWHPHTS